ncbi:response regulator [Candidatus Pacearchaeota archaeon]|nr:response regulator [Candidatus Pacearchaeota archaeon]
MKTPSKNKPRSRFKKTLIRTLVGTALAGLVLTILKPDFNNLQNSQNNENQKNNIALVVDDNPRTRDRIEVYLQDRGYTVLQVATLKQAKTTLQNNPDISKVVSDMDLTKSYPKNLSNYLTHRTEGASLINWVYNNQINGNLENIEEFTLHSTIFNSDDVAGFFSRPFTAYLSYKVDHMTKTNASFNLQPKTIILKE